MSTLREILETSTQSYRDSRFRDLCERATDMLTKAAACGLRHVSIDMPEGMALEVRFEQWLRDEERGFTDINWNAKSFQVKW